MATQKKVYLIEVDGVETSVQSISQLEKVIAETNQQLKEVDVNSQAFSDLAKTSKEAQQQLDKINTELDSASSVQRADGAKKFTEALAGGITTVTVALDAFGVSGKTLEEAQTRALQLIAAMDGIKKVVEGLSAENLKLFKSMITGFKQSAIGAGLFGNATRAALTATGIGIFLIALGAIVTYWEDIVEVIGLADEAQKEYFKNSIENLEKQKILIQQYNEEINNQIALLQLQGAAESEITDERRKQTLLQLQEAKNQQAIMREQLEVLLKINDLENGRRELSSLTNDEFAKYVELTKNGEISTEEALKNAKAGFEESNKAVVNLSNSLNLLSQTSVKNRNDEAKAAADLAQRQKEEAFELKRYVEEVLEELPLTAAKKISEAEAAAQKERDRLFKDNPLGNLAPNPTDVAKSLKATIDARDKAIAEASKNTPQVRSLLDILIGTNPDGLTDQSAEDQAAAVKEILNNAVRVYEESLNAIFGALDQNIENLRDELDTTISDQTNSLERIDNLRNELADAERNRRQQILNQIDAEEKREKQLAIEKEKLQKKLAKEEDKRAKLKKASDLAQAIGGGALAIINAAQTQPFIPLGLIATALATGLTAAQVAIISQQQYSGGGYTGDGGVYDPAGIVHKGEVVFSQRDVALLGGPERVDSMRPTFGGYANGGIVDDPDFNSITSSVAQQDFIDYQRLATVISSINVVTSIQELNNVQRTVNVINNRTAI